MNKAYNSINWKNEPSTSTAINETNLNKMDRAIDTIDNRVISLDSEKVSKEEGKSLVSNTDISKIGSNENAIQTHISNKSNPHSVTKTQVGLGNVENTSDADKPISTAQQAEFDAINNNLSQLEIDLKMLGYTVPKECPIQNYVDSDGVFHQRVGRVDLGSLNWRAYDSTRFISNVETAKAFDDSIKANAFCKSYKVVSKNNVKFINMSIGIDDAKNVWLKNNSYTDAAELKNSLQGVYLYYELETPITKTIDGNEAVAQIKSDLSDFRKKSDITTNETLIGTFNGKNYYRKLFTGISGSGGSVTVNVGGKIEIYNYYGRAYMYGQSGASDVKYPIPNKNYYIDSQNASETSFQLTIPTSSDTRKVDLVIEYTKVDE